MRLQVADICRGNAKLHFRAVCEDVPAQAGMIVRATAGDGTCVPVMVFEESRCKDARTLVVEVPQFDVKLHVSFAAVDESGEVLAGEEALIDPSKAKWQSRVNYRLHSSRAHEIRDFDVARTADRTVVRLNDCIPVYDCTSGTIVNDFCLFRGVVHIPCALDEPPVNVRCFDRRFQEVPARITLTATERVEESADMSAPLWRVAFTARVPVGCDYLVFAAYDEDGVLLDSFAAADGPMMAELKDRTSVLFGNAQADPAYHDWVIAHRPTAGALEVQRAASFSHTPRFSIVVPLFRTPIDLYVEMIESVIAQTYPHWELVLVNASPEDGDLAVAIAESCAHDKRIVAVDLAENGGIAVNTLAGVKKATGDFIAFLDHDDLLEPHALYAFARALEREPETDLLYSDEDRLGPDGRYTNANLKPDFTIDLLRCGNYICHFTAIRASLLREIEWPTYDLDGAQDFDVVLKTVEKTDRIVHVAQVLYHWRIGEGSTAADLANKPYASDAGMRAVRRHLERLGIAAQVSCPMPCHYRVDYKPVGNPLVSIVIPSKDNVGLLSDCIDSIRTLTSYPNYEVVIVENNSSEDATFEYYRSIAEEADNVRVVTWKGEGFSFPELVNFGVAEACGDYLLLLNNDTRLIDGDWLDVLVGYCQRPEVGAVGARLLYADGTIQHAGVLLSDDIAVHANLWLPQEDHGYQALAARPHAASAVTAACMMTSREAFDAVGGFTADLAVAYNDVDYCLKLREAGYETVYTPYVELYHLESQTRGYEIGSVKLARLLSEKGYMLRRWANVYAQGDPYLNRNLTRRAPQAGYFHLQW